MMGIHFIIQYFLYYRNDGLCNINHIMNHKMESNIDRITDPLIHDSQCYSMNKIWNVESNSMMIEWFVNDQCVIDDNEQEYGIDGMIFEYEWNGINSQQMKVMIEWMMWYESQSIDSWIWWSICWIWFDGCDY